MVIDYGSTWRWHDRYLSIAMLFANLHPSLLGRQKMNLMVLISGLMALVVLVYLFYVLIKPENF
jgi:K+-transporting ATPase KdpF subunit